MMKPAVWNNAVVFDVFTVATAQLGVSTVAVGVGVCEWNPHS